VLPRQKRVPVRYSTSNKAAAVVDTFIGTWSPGVLGVLFGVALLVVAFVWT
jgi:hypothetical protein